MGRMNSDLHAAVSCLCGLRDLADVEFHVDVTTMRVAKEALVAARVLLDESGELRPGSMLPEFLAFDAGHQLAILAEAWIREADAETGRLWRAVAMLDERWTEAAGWGRSLVAESSRAASPVMIGFVVGAFIRPLVALGAIDARGVGCGVQIRRHPERARSLVPTGSCGRQTAYPVVQESSAMERGRRGPTTRLPGSDRAGFLARRATS